jgi:hypothetical protein
MNMVAGTTAPAVGISAHPGTAIAVGQSDTFAVTASGGTSTLNYLWYINGAPVGGATSATFVSNTLSNGDIVTCRVSNSDICANSTLKSLTVSVGSLAVDDVNTGAGISVFPNPNSGSFFVKGNFKNIADQEVSLVVTNMLGQVVYNGLIPVKGGNLEEQIMLDRLTPGVYTLSVHTDAGSHVVHFVVGQ